MGVIPAAHPGALEASREPLCTGGRGPVFMVIGYSPCFSQYWGLLTVAGPRSKNAESRSRWCARDLIPRDLTPEPQRALLSPGAPSVATGCRVGRADWKRSVSALWGCLAPCAQAAARGALTRLLRVQNKSEFLVCICFTAGSLGKPGFHFYSLIFKVSS